MRLARQRQAAFLLIGIMLLGAGGCHAGNPLPGNSLSPAPEEDSIATSTPSPTGTRATTPGDEPTRTPSPTHTATPLPYPSPGSSGEHFYLTRPIDTSVDVSYRYGSDLNGTRATHHGVEFLAEFGEPVFAAADGLVIAAGNDFDDVFGPYPNFYGLLVVIEHDTLDTHKPLYSVYGHLSAVSVDVGQRVSRGDTLGEVGFSGAAVGSHLHFEVRVGENDYNHTRNPELWVVPFQENGQYYGVIAGRLTGTQGYPIPGVPIEIQRLDDDNQVVQQFYTMTYADISVNGDDRWEENFAIGDLVPGKYKVQFVINGLQSFEVVVGPGEVALITFSLQE